MVGDHGYEYVAAGRRDGGKGGGGGGGGMEKDQSEQLYEVINDAYIQVKGCQEC